MLVVHDHVGPGGRCAHRRPRRRRYPHNRPGRRRCPLSRPRRRRYTHRPPAHLLPTIRSHDLLHTFSSSWQGTSTSPAFCPSTTSNGRSGTPPRPGVHLLGRKPNCVLRFKKFSGLSCIRSKSAAAASPFPRSSAWTPLGVTGMSAEFNWASSPEKWGPWVRGSSVLGHAFTSSRAAMDRWAEAMSSGA